MPCVDAVCCRRVLMSCCPTRLITPRCYHTPVTDLPYPQPHFSHTCAHSRLTTSLTGFHACGMALAGSASATLDAKRIGRYNVVGIGLVMFVGQIVSTLGKPFGGGWSVGWGVG